MKSDTDWPYKKIAIGTLTVEFYKEEKDFIVILNDDYPRILKEVPMIYGNGGEMIGGFHETEKWPYRIIPIGIVSKILKLATSGSNENMKLAAVEE